MNTIDKPTYEYCKETLTNLKRFIIYKINMFKQQNLV